MPTVHLIRALAFYAVLSAFITSIAVAEKNGGDKRQEMRTAYQDFLSALDPNDLGSVHEALREFGERFDNQPVRERDAAFLAFREFYYGVEDKQDRLLWGLESEEIENDDDHIASLRESGYRLRATEGDWSVRERPDFLYLEFGNRVSEAVRIFLQLRMKELREGLGGDATLSISFESLGDRLLSWERYLVQYPDSPIRSEADFFYPRYLYLFMRGTDNTPVYHREHENGKTIQRLRPHIREVYREYVANNGGTMSGTMLKEFYSLLEANDFERSAESDTFFRNWFLPLRVSPSPASW